MHDLLTSVSIGETICNFNPWDRNSQPGGQSVRSVVSSVSVASGRVLTDTTHDSMQLSKVQPGHRQRILQGITGIALEEQQTISGYTSTKHARTVSKTKSNICSNTDRLDTMNAL